MTADAMNDQPRGEFSIQTRWGASPVEIIPGTSLQLPLEFTATAVGSAVKLEGLVDFVGDKLGCTRLEVTAASGEAVTSDLLRQVPVATLTSAAVRAGLADVQSADEGKVRVTSPSILVPPPSFPKAGPTDEALRFVALVYKLTYMLGGSPTKAIADLGMPYATAARWVSRARAASYLDATEPGRAGGVKPRDGRPGNDDGGAA